MKRDWRSTIKAFVRSRNGRLTRQRLAVAEVFMKMTGHPTMGEIEARVRRVHPGMGRATIYRTIKLLVQAGLVRVSDFGDGVRHYEPRRKKAIHFHLVCSKCGRLVEFEDPGIFNAGVEAARAVGFIPTAVELEVIGLCPQCQREEEC